jgi:thiosulfate dehydrogenase (quinone) large subunit
MVESCPRYSARSSPNSIPAIARGKDNPRRRISFHLRWKCAAESSAHLDRKLAYVVFRLSLGINLLIHGASRFLGSGVDAFSSKTATEFVGTALLARLVHAFLTVLPFAEFILGGLITLCLFTRWALTLGGLEITALIFGTALRSDWTTVSIQMIYAITYYLLLLHRADNEFSLDALFRIDRE